MLLTIDIGNTSTKFAFFDGEEIAERKRIATVRDASVEDICSELELSGQEGITAVAISSVVRELRKTYEVFGRDYLEVPTIFADHTFDLGFAINYIPPGDCGPDRLVAAYAAVQELGYPVIACDFGTATTIDFVSQDKEYRGGIIAPGIETMANSLFEKTSRLPRVEVSQPESVVGASTINSIRSGVYYGYIGLVDGIIERIEKEAGVNVPVIATGGYAELISRESKYAKHFRIDLIHLGLRDIWNSLEV
jgi:type III pantothenate kinase